MSNPKKTWRLVRRAKVAIVLVVILVSVYLLIHYDSGNHSVSRVRSDLRSLATAIETYHIDHKAYPIASPIRKHPLEKTFFDGEGNPITPTVVMLDKINGLNAKTLFPGSSECHGITTPIAYVTSLFPDPYSMGYPYAYASTKDFWVLYSAGPDCDYDIQNPEKLIESEINQEVRLQLIPFTFDPTNGTYSNGDKWRIKQ